MGRYKGHITHSYSNNLTRPTFGETIHEIKTMYLQWQLDKCQPEEQPYVLEKLKDEGLVT